MTDNAHHEHLQMIDNLCDLVQQCLDGFHLEVLAGYNGEETNAQAFARESICEDLPISISQFLLERQINPALDQPLFYEALRRHNPSCSESPYIQNDGSIDGEYSESEKTTVLRVPKWFNAEKLEVKWAKRLNMNDRPQTGSPRAEQASECFVHILHKLELYPSEKYRNHLAKDRFHEIYTRLMECILPEVIECLGRKDFSKDN